MGYIGKVPADVLIDPMVDSAAITDATIVTADIADNAVTSAKLAANSVDSSELIDGSIDNGHLAGSIAINKTLLAGGTGLTLSTNTLNVDAAQTQITSVGTIGTGVWQGTAIASAYLDADTAHLSGSTFTGDVYISASGSPSFRVTDTTNTVTGKFQADDTVGKVGTHTNHSFQLFSNNTTALTIDTSQNIGIGATSISATDWGSASPVVQISGTQPLLSFKETDATKEFQLALSGGAFYLYDSDNSSTRLLIADDGTATFAGDVFMGGSGATFGDLGIENAGDSRIDLFSNVGSGTRGKAEIFFSTDSSSDHVSCASIVMEQPPNDQGARKGQIAFKVSDGGAPAQAMLIENNLNTTFSGSIYTTGASLNSTGQNYVLNSEYAMYFNVDSTGGTAERFIFGVGRTGTSGGTEWLQIDNSGTHINTQLNINNDAFTFGDGKAKVYNFTFENDSGFTSATEYMRIENSTGNWVWCVVEVTVISGFGSSAHYGKQKREYFVRILGDNNNGNGATVTTTTIGTDSGAGEGVITLTTVGNEVTDSLLFKVQTAGGRRTSVFTKVYASNNQYLTITGQ